MKAQGTKKKSPISFEVVTNNKPVAVENAFGSTLDYGGMGTLSRNRERNMRNIEGALRFTNIDQGISPFEDCSDTVSLSRAIWLCQKAYWNVPIFKNTIDIMAEFSNSPIHWEGGNKASQEFFTALYNKVGLWRTGDQFFREYYRSGNVIMLRFDGSITKEEARKLSQVYSDEISGSEKIKLPIRYVFINPVDIRAAANVAFSVQNPYYKVLNAYEIARLKTPVTDEEKELYDSLTPQQKKDIKDGIPPLIELDPKRLHTVFYKKQDYEPLAVPMGYCVLDDIDMKLELKKMDRVILRTVESTILLITMGAAPDEGGINPAAITAMQEIFKSETVGRVLVADYTTKISFVIPELDKVLGPEKYQVINEDIANGLNNIFWGEQKFANAMVKIKVFVERLKDGRDAFINQFLLPEVKRIAKVMGFKDYPRPVFKDVDLQDDILLGTMLTRLGELGILTPEQTVQSIKSGILPTPEEMQNSQTDSFQQRQQGLYTPITGPMPKSYTQQKQEVSQQQEKDAAMKQMEKPPVHLHVGQDGKTTKVSQPGGRPKGTKKKQKSKRVKPQGSTRAATYSMAELKDVVLESDKVVKAMETAAKKQFKIKELNDQQKEASLARALSLMENEARDSWIKRVPDYIKGDQPLNEEALAQIEEIAYEHQVSRYVAVLLYHSAPLNGE